jgi:nickel transport protein
MKQIVFALMTVLLFVCTAFAHDAWVEKKSDHFEVMYGGHGDKLEPYDFSKIKEIKAYDGAGRSRNLSHKEGNVIGIKDNDVVITISFDNGVWSKTPDGWKNVSKKEAKDAVESSHAMKFGKAVVKWNDKLLKPLGMKLEIVPSRNPLSLKAGDTLRFKVLYEGKPLEGAIINPDVRDDIRTDKDGMAEVKIEKAGEQRITVGYKVALKNDPDVDVLSLSANITFKVKQ